MADRSVRVILSVVATGFSAGMSKAAADTKALTSTLETHKASVDKLANASLVAGGVIAAGVGVAVKAYADFDQQMSRVSATGADAQASLLGLREAALQAGADTKFSATEAAAGVESLLKAGVSAKDVLGGGLAGALSLASAGEMGVADAAEVAATALTQFKLQGSDVGHVADLLAAGAGNAQGEVSDMAMALKQSGLVASQFGLSIDETVGGLTAFASAGLIGSDAGTSFKSMLLALANPSSQSAKLMDELSLNVYDAQGKFIGLEGLAGQLQKRLGGLSDAQRQQALAQIFGTDAMRAASVLYDQGATGMARWTDEVNQAGYAQQVAADKMNNLKGDLEQLSGSFETSMIKLGASADGPLRGVVQGLTDIVNAAGDAPPALQAAGLAVGAVGAAGLIVVGGLGKAVVAINEARLAAQALGITAKTATLSLGAIGIALAVAGIAYGAWSQGQADAKAKADDFTSAIQGQTDAVNTNTRAVAAKQLQDSGALAAARDLGLSLETVTDAALGNADAIAKVRSATDAVTLSSGQVVASTLAAESGFSDQARTAGQATEEQLRLSASADTLSKSIIGTNAAFTSAVESQKLLNEAAGDATLTVGSQADATDDLADKQKKLAKEMQSATQAVRDNASALLQESGSAMGLESAIDAATQSVKDNGTNLDINTEKGRANRGALDQIASSALSLQKAQEATGASTESLNAYTDRARTSFIETATQMGMTGDEAAALADRYGLVPKDVPTSVTLSGASEATLTINGLREAEDALHDKSITISVYYSGANAAGMADAGVLMRASGGPVWGPGSATSDSIPAWLSNGEYVINAASAARLGLDRLHYLNAYGQLPAFASGGQVDSRVHYSQAVPRYAGGGAVSAPSGASSPSGYSVADLRAALSGLTLRIGEVSAVGDYAIGRLYAAATQGV